jgi:hypothetical protein
MKRLMLAVLALISLTSMAMAQSVGMPSVGGYWSTTDCGTGPSPCFRQYGATGSADVTASGTITTQNLVPTGTATTGSAVEISTIGYGTVTIQVTGTYTGALSPQITADGTTWVTASGNNSLLNMATGAGSSTISSASTGIWQTEINGHAKFRITGLAAMTGTATITLRGSVGTSQVAATVIGSGLTSTQVQGSSAAAATDIGAPVKVGGVQNSTPPTYSNGQRGDLQVGTRGSLHVELWGNDSGAAVATSTAGDGASNAGSGIYALSRPSLFNGSTWDREFTCTSQASATITAGSTTEIVALTASQVIRVCSFSVGIATTGTVKFVNGTGTNCGTGTADITPATTLTAGNVWSMSGGSTSVLRTATANALCLTAATGNAQVYVNYAKY